MMVPVRFRREAEADVIDALTWYRERGLDRHQPQPPPLATAVTSSALGGFGGFVMQLGLDAFEDEELEKSLVRDVAFIRDRLELIQKRFRQAERDRLGGWLQAREHHPTALGVVDILR